MKRNTGAVLLVAAIALSFSAGREASASGTEGAVSFTRDIAPIFQNHCQACHRPGQIGPMSLVTYEESRPWAKSIRESVTARTMPPYFAHSSSRPMKNDISLSDEQIATICRWVDQGAPMGDPADMPPPRDFGGLEGGWFLKKPDIVLPMPEPFTQKADVVEEYRCFAIPLGLDTEVWVKGVEFKPDNAEILHHFILFEDTRNAFPAMDAETPEVGRECGGMGELGGNGIRVLQAWAPGFVQPLSPPGVGYPISKGSDLVLQLHYANNTGTEQTDQSSFALHLAQPDETIRKRLRGGAVSANFINIKAGDPNSEHRAKVRLAEDRTIYAVFAHMHYRGKDMGLWATLPGQPEETLMWVPNYDFNWQLNYEFVEPLRAPKGTQLRMVSHHDNSTGNPYNPDPAKDVHFGLETYNEMAFAAYWYTVDDEDLNLTPSIPAKYLLSSAD